MVKINLLRDKLLQPSKDNQLNNNLTKVLLLNRAKRLNRKKNNHHNLELNKNNSP